jgi:hypothetical protein
MFGDLLFLIRQTPISAQKTPGMLDAESAQAMAAQLNDALNKKDSGRLHKTLMTIAQNFQKDIDYIPEMKTYAGIEGKIGDKVKPIAELLKNRTDLTDDLIAGWDDVTDKGFNLLTASKKGLDGEKLVSLDEAARAVFGSDKFPYIAGAGRTQAADKFGLGAINEQTRNITGRVKDFIGEVKGAFRDNANWGSAAKVMGVGLGMAALAGVLTSPSFDKRRSANSLRPEAAAGAQDHIPDEPIAGSRSPSAPPRIVHSPAAPRTAYVAPVHHQSNIDVQIKGDNQQDAVERAKMLARISSSGTANINVTHRDTTNLRSLRFRAKMRDQREEE